MKGVPNFVVDKTESSRYLANRNIPAAEYLCRNSLDLTPDNAAEWNLLGVIAYLLGNYALARQYFSNAKRNGSPDNVAQNNLTLLASILPKDADAYMPEWKRRKNGLAKSAYVIILAWGYGFWSDVDHVLGQCLFAELTGREPIVYWGPNSRYRNQDKDGDAFADFFMPLSSRGMDNEFLQDCSYFPDKWNINNIRSGAVNQWNGPQSRFCSYFGFNRKEDCIVSDFYCGVADLASWIDEEHPLHNMSIKDLYSYLVRKFLIPQPQIELMIYEQKNKLPEHYFAVHMRGTDKSAENYDGPMPEFSEYKAIVDNTTNQKGNMPILLLTDDTEVERLFTTAYGARVITTASKKSSDNTALHCDQENQEKTRLGFDVILDTIIASHADTFIGNGQSNVSCMVDILMNGCQEKDSVLLRPARRYARRIGMFC